MAEKDKVFYWIKLKKEFMDGEVIDFLMSQKHGANYVVLYQMLIMKTINTNGKLCNEIGEMIIPFDIDKIQRDCKWFDIDTVRVAMELYSRLGLIYKNSDNVFQIANFDDLVGNETYWAKQKRLQLAKQKTTFKYIQKISNEQFLLPNGERKFIDEKRYGGNGMAVWDRSMGKCEICGSTDNLCLHHNNGYSNAYEDLVVVCRTCHREIEEGKKSWNFSNKCPTDVQKPLISYTLISNNIFNYWNDKNIIKHRELTEEIDKYITKALKLYSEEEIKTYIDRYNTVIKDKNYFFDYKWTLVEFLSRKDGISSFCDDGSKWQNYLQSTKPRTPYATANEQYLKENKERLARIDETPF